MANPAKAVTEGRPTDDVDCVIELVSYSKLNDLEENYYWLPAKKLENMYINMPKSKLLYQNKQ